jgi:hypothetical protein
MTDDPQSTDETADGQVKDQEPEVSTPRLEHLKETIDDAKDAAGPALADQRDV